MQGEAFGNRSRIPWRPRMVPMRQRLVPLGYGRGLWARVRGKPTVYDIEMRGRESEKRLKLLEINNKRLQLSEALAVLIGELRSPES